MKDSTFTEMLDQLAKFQKLLANGMRYDEAYYYAFNKWHVDYDNNPEDGLNKEIVGVITGYGYSEKAPNCFTEPSQTS